MQNTNFQLPSNCLGHWNEMIFITLKSGYRHILNNQTWTLHTQKYCWSLSAYNKKGQILLYTLMEYVYLQNTQKKEFKESKMAWAYIYLNMVSTIFCS